MSLEAGDKIDVTLSRRPAVETETIRIGWHIASEGRMGSGSGGTGPSGSGGEGRMGSG